ncbi:hypothetical protein [Spirosoma flavum]|uniref:Uncharacterized protein n=1 Tax=Spirosoma flavum TaxID=2048557 RepID=A0ABW6AQ36_9BACT
METKFTKITVTVEAVNDELKRQKSDEVLTSLVIKEVAVSEEELRDMQAVIERMDTFRKFYITFKTAAGRSDSGDSFFLKSTLPFTPKVVAGHVIKELTYNQLPKAERDAIREENFRYEQRLTLILALVVFILSGLIQWVSGHVASPSVFFQYATPVRYTVSGLALGSILYFVHNPGPGRRPYSYLLIGFAFAWLIAMLLT